MPVPEELREQTRLNTRSNFASLLAQYDVTADTIEADERELDRVHKKLLAANTYRTRDTEVARFAAFLTLKEGEEAAERHLQPDGPPFPLPLLKAYVRIRARMIHKPHFPNGRTSTRAMKGRVFTLAAALADMTGKVAITAEARKQIEAYIDDELRRELSLNTGALDKPITSFEDFKRLLNSCWTAAARFHNQRERAQTHLYFILNVFDMSRPGEAASSYATAHDSDVQEGITWGDVLGSLHLPDGSEALHVRFQIRWRNLKGKRLKDDQNKDGLHEQEPPELAGFDATLFILAFGLEDGVFEHFTTIEQLESVTSDYVRAQGGAIPLVIKEDAKQFRLLQDVRLDPDSGSWQAQKLRPVRYCTMRGKWKELLRLCGYDDTANMTSLRRMYQNLCESHGVDEANRKQASGHNPNSKSFYQSYKSSVIAVDTRRIFSGLPAKATDNRVRAMGLKRYSNAAVELPVEKVREAEVPEDIRIMRSRLEELGEAIKLAHPSVSAASRAGMPEATEYEKLRSKNKKAFAKFKMSLTREYAKESSEEAARLAFQPEPTPVAESSGSTPAGPQPLNKGKARASPLGFDTDPTTLLDEADEQSHIQTEMTAGQPPVETSDAAVEAADAADQQFEERLEADIALKHPFDHQKLIDSLTAYCATSALPLEDSSKSSVLQDAFFPPLNSSSTTTTMSRRDIIHAITHSAFFTAQQPEFEFPGEQPTENNECPVLGCSVDIASRSRSSAAEHIHGCVRVELDGPVSAAEHLHRRHVVGAKPGANCAIELDDGRTCYLEYPSDDLARSRHLEIYHGLIAVRASGKKKKATVPAMEGRVLACTDCKIWLKGYAAIHDHAEQHLMNDLPEMRKNMLLCQTDFTNHVRMSSEAKHTAEKCPFELFDEALSPADRWFSGIKCGRSTGYAKHINDSHIRKLDSSEQHLCPWGTVCSRTTFNPCELAEHLRSKHAIRLTAKMGSVKGYEPLNGDMSRLLTDRRTNRGRASNKVDADQPEDDEEERWEGVSSEEDAVEDDIADKRSVARQPRLSESDGLDASQQEAEGEGDASDGSSADKRPQAKRPRLNGNQALQDITDKYSNMSGQSVKAELRGLGLPFATLTAKERVVSLRSYHNAPQNSFTRLQYVPKKDLVERCKQAGLRVKWKFTQPELARMLASYRITASSGPSTAPPETPAMAELPLLTEDGMYFAPQLPGPSKYNDDDAAYVPDLDDEDDSDDLDWEV
ncbi:hypothetical protein CI109_106546 [Kwoniella shandongensis]|uniref:Uncharacterized protein n=1 Tax=Kwoniella shandongensis TaxID=1734106 RepID=A0AAJ8N016_9TREE